MIDSTTDYPKFIFLVNIILVLVKVLERIFHLDVVEKASISIINNSKLMHKKKITDN